MCFIFVKHCFLAIIIINESISRLNSFISCDFFFLLMKIKAGISDIFVGGASEWVIEAPPLTGLPDQNTWTHLWSTGSKWTGAEWQQTAKILKDGSGWQVWWGQTLPIHDLAPPHLSDRHLQTPQRRRAEPSDTEELFQTPPFTSTSLNWSNCPVLLSLM